MTSRTRVLEGAQVLVMAAFVMAFLFVPLAVLVIDSALVEASYAQLGETTQAAAENGASSIDVAAYRASDGQTVRLDSAAATQVVDSSMRSNHLPGLQSWQTHITDGDLVTVSAQVHVQLFALGSATITQRRSATFVDAQ